MSEVPAAVEACRERVEGKLSRSARCRCAGHARRLSRRTTCGPTTFWPYRSTVSLGNAAQRLLNSRRPRFSSPLTDGKFEPAPRGRAASRERDDRGVRAAAVSSGSATSCRSQRRVRTRAGHDSIGAQSWSRRMSLRLKLSLPGPSAQPLSTSTQGCRNSPRGSFGRVARRTTTTPGPRSAAVHSPVSES